MMGDRLVESTIAGDTTLKAYASAFSSGEIGASIINPGTHPVTLRLDIPGFHPGSRYYWYSLSGDTSSTEFPRKVLVNDQTTTAPAGGPSNYASLPAFSASAAGGISITIPARGATFLVVDK